MSPDEKREWAVAMNEVRAKAHAPDVDELLPTSIHDAAVSGDLALATTLLKRNPDLVSSKDRQGRAALHFAATFGHKEIAQLLLAHNADVNVKNGGGQTPLMLAKEYGRKDLEQLLRERGGTD